MHRRLIVPTFSPLSRRVGAVHLVAAGVLHAVVGVWLVSAAMSNELVDLAIATGSTVVNDVTLLQSGPILELVSVLGVLLAVGLFAVAAVEITAGWYAFAGKRWRLALGTAVGGSITLVTLPLGIVAVTLLYLTRRQFPSSTTESRR